MITKRQSLDILLYFQKKGYTNDEIAKAMNTSLKEIKKIKKLQTAFSPDNIRFYLESEDIPLTQFLWEAVPLEHLPERVKENVILCQQLKKHKSKKSEKNT